MGSKKDRQRIDMMPSGLPDFFRRLANAWEKGAVNENFSLDPDAFSKLEIKTKGPAGVVQIVIVHKAPEAKGDKDYSFKTVKKQMKRQFKAISASLEQDDLPAKEDIHAFCQDYQRMMADLYSREKDPGKRMGLCNAMVAAREKEDPQALALAVKNLRLEMVECHKALK